MKQQLRISFVVSALLAASGSLAATTIDLGSLISGASLDHAPGQITFYLYDSRDAGQAITSQTFLAGEWQASEKSGGVYYRVSFSALDADSYNGLWYQASADGVMGGERQQIRAVTPDMYVAGELETGVGVRFPGGGLQIEPGITSETDPGLVAHAGNVSAHHSRYSDAEAVSAIKAADGPGSGLDADLLDGQHAASFAGSSHNHDTAYVNVSGDTMTGALVVNPTVGADAGDFHGDVALHEADGSKTVDIGAESGVFYLYNADSTLQLTFAGDGGTGGYMHFYNEAGIQTVRLDGDDGGAGVMQVEDSTGLRTIVIEGEESLGDGGQILMYNTNNILTAQIDGDSGTLGGYIRLYDGLGNASITLDGDIGGDGRITTQELSITGGSDLSEQFDIDAATARVEPGMLVSIDPLNPGKLVLSHEAYDRKVAGIVSGAGGVKPGMMMGQEGSIANGEFPVALTGRVYAMVDASKGAVEPGDLLTTSDVPGYAMKVTDYTRATGSVIGKAMTPLAQGKDLVLVLVSLQ